MASSTSNSEKRLVIALLTLAIGLIPVALVNFKLDNSQPFGSEGTIAERIYWKKKVAPSDRYRLVILGDSRCYRGVSPYPFGELPGINAYNAALSSGGLNAVIFKHAEENLLDHSPADAPGVVLLCITPFSLTGDARKNGHYNVLAARASRENSLEHLFSEVLFRPIRKDDLASLWGPVPMNNRNEIYHANGWCETFLTASPQKQEDGLRIYHTNYRKTTFSTESFQELIAQTAAWRKKNITVFAFTPPTTPAMQELERRESGCDMAAVRKAFEQAGGIWLDVTDPEQYNAYDGSHLNREEALRLSNDLAKQIKAHLKL